jgi:hypothetical protein
MRHTQTQYSTCVPCTHLRFCNLEIRQNCTLTLCMTVAMVKVRNNIYFGNIKSNREKLLNDWAIEEHMP